MASLIRITCRLPVHTAGIIGNKAVGVCYESAIIHTVRNDVVNEKTSLKRYMVAFNTDNFDYKPAVYIAGTHALKFCKRIILVHCRCALCIHYMSCFRAVHL